MEDTRVYLTMFNKSCDYGPFRVKTVVPALFLHSLKLRSNRYLLDKGANPNIKANDGLDPLMAAVESGDKAIVTLLIDKGADLNSRTKLTTPVYIANEKGHVEISQLLVERGAPLHPSFLWHLRRSAIRRWQNLSCINS